VGPDTQRTGDVIIANDRIYVRFLSLLCVCALICGGAVSAREDGWYTEGDFAPIVRIRVNVTNTLNFSRTDCPVIITRCMMPVPDINGNMITVVDPSLPAVVEITQEEKNLFRSHAFQAETNGHNLPYQLDDLDKDGVWDELLFMIDIAARETRTLYLYIGFNGRGPYSHETHAVVGNYLRRFVPFWESKKMLWKLYFPTDVDLMGKRNPLLVGYESVTTNRSDYSMPREQGSDIMDVGSTFGAGGICLFEEPAFPDSVSRPRFSPYSGSGQLTDTRYAFDVVVNGPLRSMIRVHTMNWRTGKGEYELEQLYTAYKNKYYYTCKVHYLRFFPEWEGVGFGCGVRKIMNEDESGNLGMMVEGGALVTPGTDIISGDQKIGFEALALVVKDIYKPTYQFIKGFGGNHTFRIPVTDDLTYEYLVAAAWNEGMEHTDAREFRYYVLKEAQEYNNQLVLGELIVESK